jgi:hypothetical protein
VATPTISSGPSPRAAEGPGRRRRHRHVAGASGTVGAREISARDGYRSTPSTTTLTYYTGVSDVSCTDFEPVACSSTPSVLTASPKTKWSSWQEPLAMRRRPGQTRSGHARLDQPLLPGADRAGGRHQVQVRVLRGPRAAHERDPRRPHRPHRLEPHAEGQGGGGQLRFLAIATEKRSPEIPTVPTLKELGINVVFSVERGIMAPKGTPADVLAKLEAACAQATKDPAFAESMRKQGTDVNHLDRKAYAEYRRNSTRSTRTGARPRSAQAVAAWCPVATGSPGSSACSGARSSLHAGLPHPALSPSGRLHPRIVLVATAILSAVLSARLLARRRRRPAQAASPAGTIASSRHLRDLRGLRRVAPARIGSRRFLRPRAPAALSPPVSGTGSVFLPWRGHRC